MTQTETPLADLYLEDETAWLEAMAERIQVGALTELDYPHLQEYLTDMAIRDRREVLTRLVILMMHILKWVYQPEKRSGSWQNTIFEQQLELSGLVESGVLRNHAKATISDAYLKAVRGAKTQTGLPLSIFPAECAYSLEELLSFVPDSSEIPADNQEK